MGLDGFTMNIAEQIKNGALTDPKTLWGAILGRVAQIDFGDGGARLCEPQHVRQSKNPWNFARSFGTPGCCGSQTRAPGLWATCPLPAFVFLFFAWLSGRASHLAVQRLLAKEREFVSVRPGRCMAIYVGSRATINE
jgi:hypothetical protein